MDYFQMICKRNAEAKALAVDGKAYTYGELACLARELGESFGTRQEKEDRRIHVIKEKDIISQLVSFLACYVSGEIPLIVPFDSKNFENGQRITDISIPERACMAVATSGTTGEPKIYFRSYESWAGYFPVQNEIFQITEKSRLFAQGSLAFTGNLNLYMGQFYAGGTVVAETAFLPGRWEERIGMEDVNCIYLIPSKLMLLPKVLKKENPAVRMILSGSQSLGKADAAKLKKVFPNTRILLYYGASELNYITYVTDEFMSDDRNLIGKPFPGVDVCIREEELYVTTDYHVENVECPYSLSDKGRQDGDGNFYFLGRKDDMMNVRGRKISSLKIENKLEELSEVREAAVVLEGQNGKDGRIAAFVVPETGYLENVVYEKLRDSLEHYEMPRRIYTVEGLPKNESGKVDKKKLNMLY